VKFLIVCRTPMTISGVKEPSSGGLPPKACTNRSMNLLESILHKGCVFENLQARLNTDLVVQLVSIKSTRAYVYARNYKNLKVVNTIITNSSFLLD
jgi:hypothetical protein